MMPSDLASLANPSPGVVLEASSMLRISFTGMGDVLLRVAPQFAAQGAWLLWNAYHNAAAKAKADVTAHTRPLAEAIMAHSVALDKNQSRPLFIEEKTWSPDGPPGAKGESPQKWGSLGKIEFGLTASPTAFSAKDGEVYAQHAVIGGKPRIQWTGDALQTLTMTVRWDSLLEGKVETGMERLMQAMRGLEVLPLVIGESTAGSVYAGAYIITGIDHKVTKYNPDGSMSSVEATVNLLEWVDAPDLEISEVKRKAVQKKQKRKPAPGWHWDEKGNYVRDAK